MSKPKPQVISTALVPDYGNPVIARFFLAYLHERRGFSIHFGRDANSVIYAQSQPIQIAG